MSAGRANSKLLLLAAMFAVTVAGCGKPYAANIALRKENQALQEEVRQLKAMRQADASNRFIAVGEPDGVPVDRLFTAHGLRVGRLTGVFGDTLRVFVVPTDQRGDLLKAAGSFEVRAFDLDQGEKAQVGVWRFTDEEAAWAWNGQALQYGFVLECPLERTISESQVLTVRIVFTDLLTGRRIETDTTARVRQAASHGASQGVSQGVLQGASGHAR